MKDEIVRWGQRKVGWLIGVIAALVFLIGLVTLYSKTTNFITCQAQYNQQQAAARQARVGPAARENDHLYHWLKTLPPLLTTAPGDQPDPHQNLIFKNRLVEALKTHERNVEARRNHPYPANPVDTCGEY